MSDHKGSKVVECFIKILYTYLYCKFQKLYSFKKSDLKIIKLFVNCQVLLFQKLK